MTLELDPDRRLALAYAPAAFRPALEALWRLDVTFAAVLATGREPALSQIKLAWWREALERLDREPPPPEPVLQALAAHVIPAGLAGAALAEMEAGWVLLLPGERLGPDALATYAAGRGGLLLRFSAFLLGASDTRVEQAGEGWALVDLARHSRNPDEKAEALTIAAARLENWPWPRPLRPLGMLAALARRDAARGPAALERQGSPARILRMIRHRLTGT